MPPYYYPPPPQKKDNVVKIVVIILVVIFVVPIILAAVLYVMVSGLVVNPGPVSPTIGLAAGTWSGENLVVQVTWVSGPPVFVDGLRFEVQSRNGTVCFDGAANASAQTGCPGTSVSVFFSDTQGEGQVDAPDQIRITASPPTDVRGGSLRVVWGGGTLGATNLPS